MVLTAPMEVDKAAQRESEFLSRASHELRTPMNAILGFTQILELEPLSVEAREDLAQVRKAGEHLLGLIGQMHDFSAGDDFYLEPVSLDDVTSEAVARLLPLFESRGLRLEGLEQTAGKSVIADRARLRQVLENVLTNAAKYNRPGGMIGIEAVEGPEEFVSLSISDEGHGLSKEKLNRLFNAFDRLGAEDKGIEGTGLGLAVSRNLLQNMQGDLVVASREGKGSTFTLRLPSAFSTTDDMPPVGSRQILYIEEEGANAHLVRRILRERSEVFLATAPNMAAGLTRLSNAAAVLADLSDPSLVRWLRTEAKKLPLIVLTQDQTPGHSAKMIAAGADYCLTKPLNPGLFLQVINMALEVAS